MKILVIDTLTETHNSNNVRSGLQRSAVMDVHALSKEHEVTFMYCGTREDGQDYTHHIIAEHGAKDYLINQGLIPKNRSAAIIKDMIRQNKSFIDIFDYIIVHVHSFASFYVAEIVQNKNILFIVHDILDYFYYEGLQRQYKKIHNNNSKILTNSQYSINRAKSIYDRRRAEVLHPDEVFYGYIKHFIWTDIKPEVKEKGDFSSVIGRIEPAKFHHRFFKFEHESHKIHHYGVKDPRRDVGFKYYEKLKASGNNYFLGLNDEDLWSSVSKSMNILIPCWHEGFGYTAFEAGIYGSYPIILENRSPSTNIGHATSEYLTRAGVPHMVIPFQAKDEEIYNEIIKARNIKMDTRNEISRSLLEYFSVGNYIQERIELFNKPIKKYNNEVVQIGLEL